jgi:hypothetical protein
MRCRTLVVALATLGAGAAPSWVVAEQVQFAGHEGQIEFVLPSQNIGCIFTPAGGTSVYKTPDGGPELQCDRVEPNYVRIILSGSGRAREITNVGDASCCGASNVLRYGQSWSGGPFTCDSSEAGLACRRGTAGFAMSRAAINIF